MRSGSCIAFGLALMVVIEAIGLGRAAAMPFALNLNAGAENIYRVEDTCWWWGTRWHYGWRGYGWYSCWDWPKPGPTVVAPEAVPDEARPAIESCVQAWRDAGGYRHRRRTC
jgi:hypothetical protein